MSRVVCGFVRLLRRLDHDSALDPGSIGVHLLQITLRDHVSQVFNYFMRGLISLEGVDVIRLEGSEVSPLFAGKRSSVKGSLIPLAFTVTGYDADSYIIEPFNIPRVRENMYSSYRCCVKIAKQDLENSMGWYLARGSLYPFALARLFKILYREGGVKATGNLLQRVYKAEERALANTLSILKVPSQPDIPCRTKHKAYLVLYRCTRSFVSTVIEPRIIDNICEKGNGIIIDHHVSYMLTQNREAAYYYSALLNYMVSKISRQRLGTFVRDQFGRPLKAIKESGLEWKGDMWQLEVARISTKIHACARKVTLRELGVESQLSLYELFDEGRDLEVKSLLGIRSTRVLTAIEGGECGFEEIIKIFDNEADMEKLIRALKMNVIATSSV